jgi:hypothetical protein
MNKVLELANRFEKHSHSISDVLIASKILRCFSVIEKEKNELLEALKNLINYVENNLSNDCPTGIDINSRWFDEAYAAIKKGEKP